tara:strand:- start:5651 stop:6319 length:669 start_codon:yes stop_codon:yes gene_type:complete
MKDFISVIPIREGSKGLKKKNLSIINGIPLYLRAVNQALRITDKCILNTDIPEVINKKFQHNVQIYNRDKKYAKDDTSMNIVLKDLFSNINLKDKIILLLQATSPLRIDKDIKEAINIFKSGQYSLVLSVKKVNSGVLKQGYINNKEFIPINKKYLFSNRQSLPNIYAPNGAIYIFSVTDFLKNNCIPSDNIGFYEMPLERSIDIDNKKDIIKVNELIKNGY